MEVYMLKKYLAKEFEIKGLERLRYFLEIEVARPSHLHSQMKYILDLLVETRMLGCWLANSPIEVNHHLVDCKGEVVEK